MILSILLIRVQTLPRTVVNVRRTAIKIPIAWYYIAAGIVFFYNKNMRYYISLLLCFTLAASSAQVSDRQIKENMAKLDSQTRELNESMARTIIAIARIIEMRL